MAFSKKTQFAEDLQELSDYCKALSHPARLSILVELSKNGKSTCGEIVNLLPLAQATVSQHLKELVESGLVQVKAHGVAMVYGISKKTLSQKNQALFDLISKLAKKSKKSKRSKS